MFLIAHLVGFRRWHVAAFNGVLDLDPHLKLLGYLRISRELLEIDIPLHFFVIMTFVAPRFQHALSVFPSRSRNNGRHSQTEAGQD